MDNIINTINDLVIKQHELHQNITTLQIDLEETRQRAVFTKRMTVFGDWIMYFMKNVLVHEMKQRPMSSLRTKKLTMPLLLMVYRKSRDVEVAVDNFLRAYDMDMSTVELALDFVNEYCPDASYHRVNLSHPPVVRYIDNRYDAAIDFVVKAVIKATK